MSADPIASVPHDLNGSMWLSPILFKTDWWPF